MDDNHFNIESYTAGQELPLNTQGALGHGAEWYPPQVRKPHTIKQEPPSTKVTQDPKPSIKPENFQSYSMVRVNPSISRADQSVAPRISSESKPNDDKKAQKWIDKIFPKGGLSTQIGGIGLNLASSAFLISKKIKVLPAILSSIAIGTAGIMLIKKGFPGAEERLSGSQIKPQDQPYQSKTTNKFFQYYDKIFPSDSLVTGSIGLGAMLGGLYLAFGLPILPGALLLSTSSYLGSSLIQKGFFQKSHHKT